MCTTSPASTLAPIRIRRSAACFSATGAASKPCRVAAVSQGRPSPTNADGETCHGKAEQDRRDAGWLPRCDRRRLRRLRSRLLQPVRPLPARTALYARPRTEMAGQARRGLRSRLKPIGSLTSDGAVAHLFDIVELP